MEELDGLWQGYHPLHQSHNMAQRGIAAFMIGIHVALCQVAMYGCILIECHRNRIHLITMAAGTGLGKSMGRPAQDEDQHKNDR